MVERSEYHRSVRPQIISYKIKNNAAFDQLTRKSSI